ncbi:TIM-barrel domain-containing protein, partial [Flavihumibacter sp. CACIAM 22H1]|uniref:glycoside hydrolase family 31 protein n=1 Tax=Flavihumibacter sp. CACIAM 22H1 TaxID=1812911 RepID=UPI000A705318
IVLDWSYWKEDEWGSQEFEQSRFPSADSLIKLLHNKYHTRFMISVWPKFYEGIKAYEDFQSKGWLYPRNIADRQRDWIGKGYVSTFYDAFNPAARKGFWDLINKNIYAKGIDAWWMDASEPDILSNVSPEKRILQMGGTYYGAAAEWLNAYPLQNAKGIYEGQRSIDSNKRVFLLTRSGFAGSQRYAATIWSGDIGSTWSDMKTQITAGINYSLSGLPYWTMDIGGFVVPKRFEQPGQEDLEEWRELNTRWFQFGAFVPLFRSHGQFPFREPYNIAPEHHAAYKSMQAYLQLRYRLLPYNYSINGLVYHKDYTLMRGLVMDFAQDTAVLKIDDQYMFGPSLLICPVTSYKARERSVYLPSGKGWYDLYTGRFFSGGQSIKAPAPYEQMPVFVPEGAILPMGPELQYTTEKVADTITLFVYKGRDGAFALYEDDGLNYDYEHGKFSNIPITYKAASNTLIIGNRAGTYPGMLSKRVFRIVAVASNNAAGFNPASKVYRTVRYNGKELSIKL